MSDTEIPLTPLTERLLLAAQNLNEDELAVLCEVADGLKLGQAVYGKLQLSGDARRFEEEMLAEIRDAITYSGMRLVQLRRAQKERGE